MKTLLKPNPPSPFFPILVVGALALAPQMVWADVPLHQRIDQEIEAALPGFASKAAPLAGDDEFLRRIFLDLTGMVPSVKQTREFLKDTSPDKRAKLIDKLLASPEYSHHMQHVFDALWMERRKGKNVPDSIWETFLHDSFAKNKPFDELVRDVLSADGSDPKNRGPARFFLDRQGEPHEITKDVSRLFLGMNLHCAQCHDHPIVEAYKQDHYYGLYAFFSRSYLFNDKSKKQTVFAEKADGKVTFQSVFKPKITKETAPRLPGLSPLKEPDFPKGKEYKVAPGKDIAGVPAFSRRAQLGKMLAGLDNAQFKRAAANRFWFLMMGRGLVHPVDYDHPANPPSHPKLLDLLTEEFAAMKFDMKGFIRQIALSKTYQRSSKMPTGKELPPENSFALAEVRPLSPEQLAWSIMQATGMVEAEYSLPKANEASVYSKLQKNVTPFINIFGGSPGDPADLGFQATLNQTLFLRNGPIIRGWLAPKTGNLTDRLMKLKDGNSIAEELFLSVLTRRPSMEEVKLVQDFLNTNQSDRSAAIQELAWAVIASAEFRFNH